MGQTFPPNPNTPNIRLLDANAQPMSASPGAIDSIKGQFLQQQNDTTDAGLVLPPGADAPTPPPAPAMNLYPFPGSGNIVEWLVSPARADLFIIVCNIEPDETKPTRPSVLASCRQPEVATMLCDGVNYLFSLQHTLDKVKKMQKELSEQSEAGTPVDSTPKTPETPGQ